MTLSAAEILQRHGIAYIHNKKGRFTTNCPACGNGYLSVEIRRDGVVWHCKGCGDGGGEPFAPRTKKKSQDDLGPIKAVYDYTDESGALLFQVVRYEPVGQAKTFRQRKGPGQWGIKGVRLVPFELPTLIEAIASDRIVFIVEGEKDCLTLARHGVVATTNAMGVGHWHAEFAEFFRNADVVICGDNDAQGHEHVADIVAKLKGFPRRLRVLDLSRYWPAIEAKDDISDWFAAGHSVEQLWDIVGMLDAPSNGGGLTVAGEATAEDGGERSKDDAERGQPRRHILPSPNQPMAVARLFVTQHCQHDQVLTLRHWRGGWWMWKRTHWVEVNDSAVRSILYRFTEHALYFDGFALADWSPTRNKIANLFDALCAICVLADDVDQPCWLDTDSDLTVVSVANGLLDIERRRLLPHTPQYFSQTSVPFRYDPQAAQPVHWLKFLGELWPKEPQAIDALGEWAGYVISGRTDLHKILLMVGPTRGGKGAIARVLAALIGRKNVAGPTLNSLGGEFGLAPLIGKPLAVISDARFAGRDASVVVERLLSISGEDLLTINRKYREQWNGKLPSRLHVLSNELPKLGDASTAIVGRFVLLLLSNSWLGREDHTLESRLHGELSGILNWALDGLHRLVAVNGNRFTPVESAADAITSMRDLASPVAAFVRERCEVGPHTVPVDELYADYKRWCEDNGHQKKTKETFGRDLRAANPAITRIRPRADQDRYYQYTGIRLRP